MKEQSAFSASVITQIKDNLPAVIVIVGTLVLAVAVGIAAGPSQIINSIVTGGMWALLATGLALVFGVMNIPHFAHGESFMVGAFVAYYTFNPIHTYLQDHPNAFLTAVAPLIGFLSAAIAGFILGAILERIIFRPLRMRSKSGWVMNTFLLTVGISFVLINGVTLAPSILEPILGPAALDILGPTFRGIPNYWPMETLTILGARVHFDRIVAFLVSVLTIAALWFFLRQTRTGRAIRAVSQDETGAQLVGINLNFIYTLTFALATATAALAGAALLFMFQAYPTVGLKPLYVAWYVVMLAGLGNVAGAIVGGFIVAVLQTATQQFVGIAWENVVPVAAMILVLILVPSGIFGSEVKGVQEQ
ncbi:MAG: branched-chain amino acid ABC transporter permease [Anaerolineae bacterium]|jgi:branched-chain amino acid transport system permease protein